LDNPKYLFPNASPFPTHKQGEAKGYKNLGQVTQLIALLLRPYIIDRWGLLPP
jgi:hypothetical protein